MKTQKMTPIGECETAKLKHQELTAALPKLLVDAKAAAATRTDLAERLERLEGDALIGKVDESVLKTARARHDAAVIEDRKASASARQTQQDIERIEQRMPELMREADEARIAELRPTYEAAVRELVEAMTRAAAASATVSRLYQQARTEFPHVSARAGGSPHPVAAGLPNLAWPELLEQPHATNKGRLGTWLKQAQWFLDPSSRPEPRKKQRMGQPFDPPPAPARREGVWAAIKERF
jgi:hypothetical protein